MARAIIYRGDDKKISLTLKKNGVAIPLSSLTGYIVYLYYVGSGKVLQKYSKNALADYKTITETDVANGVFTINLERTDTETAGEGDINAEIKTQITDNAFDLDTFHTIAKVEIGTIKDSLTKKVIAL